MSGLASLDDRCSQIELRERKEVERKVMISRERGREGGRGREREMWPLHLEVCAGESPTLQKPHSGGLPSSFVDDLVVFPAEDEVTSCLFRPGPSNLMRK